MNENVILLPPCCKDACVRVGKTSVLAKNIVQHCGPFHIMQCNYWDPMHNPAVGYFNSGSSDGMSRPSSGTVAGRLYDHRVLVVEDAPEVARLVADNLRQIVREVTVCGDGRTALKTLERECVDLVILDVMLPELDGLEVCRALRAAGNTIPILMLSARSSELDRIVGIEFGADDYMLKPFSMLELLARVKALFRRCDHQAANYVSAKDSRLMVANLSIDRLSRQVSSNGKEVPLTEKEFDLLCVFASNPGRVYSRSQLLDLVWGSGSGVYEGTVTSHINRLRARIEPDPANPTIIETVWGIGYRLHSPLNS